MNVLEWTSTVLSLIYVVLAIRNNRWCFPFAVAASAIWCHLSWSLYNLKFDAMLQVFYAVMAVVGWLKWGKPNTTNQSKILQLGLQKNILFIAVGMVLSFTLDYLGGLYFTASYSFLDALTTVFSVMATLLMINRIIDNWVYLLVADLLYIYIYWQQGAKLFAGLMVVYSVMAIVGFVNWWKISQAKRQSTVV